MSKTKTKLFSEKGVEYPDPYEATLNMQIPEWIMDILESPLTNMGYEIEVKEYNKGKYRKRSYNIIKKNNIEYNFLYIDKRIILADDNEGTDAIGSLAFESEPGTKFYMISEGVNAFQKTFAKFFKVTWPQRHYYMTLIQWEIITQLMGADTISDQIEIIRLNIDIDQSATSIPIKPEEGPSVFICYAHEDNINEDKNKRWKDRLIQHLQPIENQKQIQTWSDKDIEIGDLWHEKIQNHLKVARVAVLLVSPAFLASKYIRESEVPVLLKRAKEKGVTILPIILRPCLFKETKFKYPDPINGPEEFTLSDLQAAASQNKALNELSEAEQDRVLLSVAQEITKIVNIH